MHVPLTPSWLDYTSSWRNLPSTHSGHPPHTLGPQHHLRSCNLRLKFERIIRELKNIARVRNCPDVAILSSLFGLRLFDFLTFCLVLFFPFCLFFTICLFVFFPFCLFVFLSWQHSDQMSEGSQVSKVTLCVKILKWQSVTHPLSHWPRSGIELPGQLKINFIKNNDFVVPSKSSNSATGPQKAFHYFLHLRIHTCRIFSCLIDQKETSTICVRAD